MDIPESRERTALDEALFGETNLPEEGFGSYIYPDSSVPAVPMAPPPTIEIPVPQLSVLGDLLVPWGECATLTPDVIHFRGPPPVLIDLLLLSTPHDGALLRDGFVLQPGDVFTQEDIDFGRIAYRHGGEQPGPDHFRVSTPNGDLPITEVQVLIAPAVGEIPQSEVPSDNTSEASAEGTPEPEISNEPAPASSTLPFPEPKPEIEVRTASEAPTAEEGSFLQANCIQEQPASPQSTLEEPATSDTESEPVIVKFEPVILPQLAPPWRVAFSAEAVCGTGLALVRLEGPGRWQLSTDQGQTWEEIGAVYHGRARLLKATDRLRFVPYSAAASGKVILGARAWMSTAPAPASGIISLASSASVQPGSGFGPQVLTLRWKL
jgi:hypothetical protein